jgi:hypothetical protein
MASFRKWVLAALAGVAMVMSVNIAMARGGPNEVDVELVLAVDISYSMDYEEQRLQREGYIQALTSKEVLDAIRQGAVGRVAITYVEWAGVNRSNVIVPWQVIDGRETADAFVAKIAAAPIRRDFRTSISGALMFSAALFENNGFDAVRRVIDVSGDGANNEGPPITLVRNNVLKEGIVINGLPILINNSRRSSFDMENLDEYYRDCVIGGPGAFLIPVTERHQFVDAIRTKIVREIATAPLPSDVSDEFFVVPVQAEATRRVDCLSGERQWMERYRN